MLLGKVVETVWATGKMRSWVVLNYFLYDMWSWTIHPVKHMPAPGGRPIDVAVSGIIDKLDVVE